MDTMKREGRHKFEKVESKFRRGKESYCEVCHKDYFVLREHILVTEHVHSVSNSDMYRELNDFVGSFPSVDIYLRKMYLDIHDDTNSNQTNDEATIGDASTTAPVATLASLAASDAVCSEKENIHPSNCTILTDIKPRYDLEHISPEIVTKSENSKSCIKTRTAENSTETHGLRDAKTVLSVKFKGTNAKDHEVISDVDTDDVCEEEMDVGEDDEEGTEIMSPSVYSKFQPPCSDVVVDVSDSTSTEQRKDLTGRHREEKSTVMVTNNDALSSQTTKSGPSSQTTQQNLSTKIRVKIQSDEKGTHYSVSSVSCEPAESIVRDESLYSPQGKHKSSSQSPLLKSPPPPASQKSGLPHKRLSKNSASSVDSKQRTMHEWLGRKGSNTRLDSPQKSLTSPRLEPEGSAQQSPKVQASLTSFFKAPESGARANTTEPKGTLSALSSPRKMNDSKEKQRTVKQRKSQSQKGNVAGGSFSPLQGNQTSADEYFTGASASALNEGKSIDGLSLQPRGLPKKGKHQRHSSGKSACYASATLTKSKADKKKSKQRKSDVYDLDTSAAENQTQEGQRERGLRRGARQRYCFSYNEDLSPEDLVDVWSEEENSDQLTLDQRCEANRTVRRRSKIQHASENMPPPLKEGLSHHETCMSIMTCVVSSEDSVQKDEEIQLSSKGDSLGSRESIARTEPNILKERRSGQRQPDTKGSSSSNAKIQERANGEPLSNTGSSSNSSAENTAYWKPPVVSKERRKIQRRLLKELKGGTSKQSTETLYFAKKTQKTASSRESQRVSDDVYTFHDDSSDLCQRGKQKHQGIPDSQGASQQRGRMGPKPSSCPQLSLICEDRDFEVGIPDFHFTNGFPQPQTAAGQSKMKPLSGRQLSFSADDIQTRDSQVDILDFGVLARRYRDSQRIRDKRPIRRQLSFRAAGSQHYPDSVNVSSRLSDHCVTAGSQLDDWNPLGRRKVLPAEKRGFAENNCRTTPFVEKALPPTTPNNVSANPSPVITPTGTQFLGSVEKQTKFVKANHAIWRGWQGSGKHHVGECRPVPYAEGRPLNTRHCEEPADSGNKEETRWEWRAGSRRLVLQKTLKDRCKDKSCSTYSCTSSTDFSLNPELENSERKEKELSSLSEDLQSHEHSENKRNEKQRFSLSAGFQRHEHSHKDNKQQGSEEAHHSCASDGSRLHKTGSRRPTAVMSGWEMDRLRRSVLRMDLNSDHQPGKDSRSSASTISSKKSSRQEGVRRKGRSHYKHVSQEHVTVVGHLSDALQGLSIMAEGSAVGGVEKSGGVI